MQDHSAVIENQAGPVQSKKSPVELAAMVAGFFVVASIMLVWLGLLIWAGCKLIAWLI